MSQSSKLAYLLLLSIALNVVLASAYLAQLQAYARETEELSGMVAQLSYQLNLTLSQLEFYRQAVESRGNVTAWAPSGWALGSSEVNLVAVRSTSQGLEGVVLKCEVKLLPGTGRVLVDTEPRIGIDLQASARTAVDIAEKFTGHELSDVDVVVRVVSEEEGIEVVDGPSAGAAIAAAVISAIRGERLNDTVYATGTINPDGSVGWVGGVLEKALAAAQHGATLFIVPKGQRVVQAWRVVEEVVGPFVIKRYEPVYVDVQDFLESRGFDVEVVEASNIVDVYAYLASVELSAS